MPKTHAKAKARTIRKPKHSVIGNPRAIEQLLLKLRIASVMRGRVGARRAVDVCGVGKVVVAKDRAAHIVATINGKRIKTSDLIKAVNQNTLQKSFGNAGDKATAPAPRQAR